MDTKKLAKLVMRVAKEHYEKRNGNKVQAMEEEPAPNLIIQPILGPYDTENLLEWFGGWK